MLWSVSDKDKQGNLISGNIIVDNVKNSYLRSEGRLIVGIGLENLVVVETMDALLVADLNKSQSIKQIVAKLHSKGQPEGSIHKIAAKIMGAESCNGWTYWHYNVNGNNVSIDSLRQKFIAGKRI